MLGDKIAWAARNEGERSKKTIHVYDVLVEVI